MQSKNKEYVTEAAIRQSSILTSIECVPGMLKFVGCKQLEDDVDAASLHLVVMLMNRLCYDH